MAEVEAGKCDGCQECLEVCSYEGAIGLALAAPGGGKPVAQINPALCKGCGTCAAACSKGAIQVKGWRLDQFEAMVDALCAEDLVEATR